MTWRQYGRKKYYYKSERSGGKIRTRYFGSGAAGELAYLDHLCRRYQAAARAREKKRVLDELRESGRTIERICRHTAVLVQSHMLLAGFYQHNHGSWRLRSGTAKTRSATTKTAHDQPKHDKGTANEPRHEDNKADRQKKSRRRTA
jgi:hypothetical protein